MSFNITRGNLSLNQLVWYSNAGIPVMTSAHTGNLNSQRLAVLAALGSDVVFLAHEWTEAEDAYPCNRLKFEGSEVYVSNDHSLVGPAATWSKPPFLFSPGFQMKAAMLQKWGEVAGVWSDIVAPVLQADPFVGLAPQLGQQWEVDQPLTTLVPTKLLTVSARTPAQYLHAMNKEAFPNAPLFTASEYLLGWSDLPYALELIAHTYPQQFYEWVENGQRRSLIDAGPQQVRYEGGPAVQTAQLACKALELLKYATTVLNNPSKTPDPTKFSGPILSTAAYIVLPVAVALANGGSTVHHLSGTSMVSYLLDDEGSAARRAELDELWKLPADEFGLPADIEYILHPTNHLPHFWYPQWAASVVNRIFDIYGEWNRLAEQSSHRSKEVRAMVDAEAPDDETQLRQWAEAQLRVLNERMVSSLARAKTRENVHQIVSGARFEADETRKGIKAKQDALTAEATGLLQSPAGQCLQRGFVSSQLDVVLGGWGLHPFALELQPSELEGLVNWCRKTAAKG